MVSTIASVEPMVTTISVSGSYFMPMKRSHLRESAWRKFGAPIVMGYWCGPSRADLLQSVSHRLGRVKVGKALRQVDRAAVDADARHPSDDGVGKMLVSSAQFLHGITAPFLICPCRQSLRPSRPRTFYNSETLTLLLDKVNRPFVQNQDKRAAASHALRGSRFLRCRTAAAGTRPAAQGSAAGRRRPSAPR